MTDELGVPAEGPYRVKLSDIFEGPMDLLVHLIKKNEINIYDIPIAMVTEQYLQYLEWLDAMNVEYAAEFVVMASTLTQIKSRLLLPVHAEEEGEEEDPRQALVRPLLEYLKLKSAAEQLAERPLLGEDTFTRTAKPSMLTAAGDEEVIKIGLFELIDAFQKILAGLPDEARIEFTTDTISVKERISQIADQLEVKGSLTFFELFSDRPIRSEIVVTFLAILEMVKLALIRLVQHVNSGIIRIFYL
ncbi:MAG: segregation and condensation protein A [Hyphomicrobiales bacterium]